MTVVPLGAGLPAGTRALPHAVTLAIVAGQLILNMYFWQHPKNLWNAGDDRAAICQGGGSHECSHLPSFEIR